MPSPPADPVASVLAGLPGTRRESGTWLVAGKVLASVDGDAVVVRTGGDPPTTVVALDDPRLPEVLTDAWESRAPTRVVREWKGTT